MAYNNPYVVTYDCGQVDFGAGTGAGSIKAPAGFTEGRIIDVGITKITETFACDSTTGKFRVGTSGDADAYAELIITDGTAATDTFNTQNDTDAIISADVTNAQIEWTTVQCVDGSAAAGIGNPYIVVAWY